jgi:hypothetical protein
MKNYSRIILTILISLISILAYISINVSINPAQKGFLESNKTPTALLEVKNHDGWKIPGIKRARVVETKNSLISEVTVLEEKLKLSSEASTNIEYYSLNQNNKLEMFSVLCYVESIYSYSLNGKKFAYRVFYSPLLIEDGIEVKTRAISIIHYYDEDGDGKFEVRYERMKEPKLPAWFQKNS